MLCPKCRTQNEPFAQQCRECGEPLPVLSDRDQRPESRFNRSAFLLALLMAAVFMALAAIGFFLLLS